ncbi:hypothetical protein BC629DRAFT_1446172 [Irpex lacteus]|nr:hypothetical protein BC629DRAFT_1446172 [Irpex lacteus]
MARSLRPKLSTWDEEANPHRFSDFEALDFEDTSSIAPPSSPATAGAPLPSLYNLMFADISSDEDYDEDYDPVGDPDWVPQCEEQSDLTEEAGDRRPALSEEQKVCAILGFMKEQFPRLSLKGFLNSLFRSEDPNIRTYTGIFLNRTKGGPWLMETVWDCGTRMQAKKYNDKMSDWVIDKAAELCSHECSHLTDSASKGPHYGDAQRLRVKAKDVSVDMVRSFKLENLTGLYDRTLPRTQRILSAVIAKDSGSSTARDANDARTYTTSMLLNMRSRNTNYHAAINALVYWDQQVPKRLLEAFNHIGLCSSYPYQVRAVNALSKDVQRVASAAANDPNNLVTLPYDNYNWQQIAHEVSVLHRTLQHDQVSAMHLTARHLASAARFKELVGSRLNVSAEQSLVDIMPNTNDRDTFRLNAIHHIAEFLSGDLPGCKRFASSIGTLDDPAAIEPKQTRRYYLPTFDQEQSSTRGNMVVLEHYFLDVLKMPKPVFEDIKVFILGDRLTTARDRAAQDQRSVDTSPWCFDHLSCFEMLGGLMHYSLNMIQNFGRVYWGTTGATDALSLQTLRDELPNRAGINTRKYDFYAWLRFLNVILRALAVSAALAHLDRKLEDVSRTVYHWTPTRFQELCAAVVDEYLLPALDGLEADGTKSTEGDTESGHAVLLLHDLMTLHEMRDAIKKGHPTRVLRVLKFWAPMYYAGGGYNYSHETMELLHNIIHDWPTDTADVLLSTMIVNTTGRPNNFKEGDLDVEHLNNAIKSRAHGPNATPKLLEKITPAIGELRGLVRQLFDDLDVEDMYQRHAHVKQDEDVLKLVGYMQKNNIFRWTKDKASSHVVPDLFRGGLMKLSGQAGGHMKHLMRHKLRLRTRHGQPYGPAQMSEEETALAQQADQELGSAADTRLDIEHTAVEPDLFDIPDEELLALPMPI